MGDVGAVETLDKTESAGAAPKAECKGGIDWADPKIPAGDAPPMGRWPLAVAALAWIAGIVFLAAMTVSRFRTESL
jgi:hypothetical protein